jgi:predicted enzyme related to lactoylglutathione lyase
MSMNPVVHFEMPAEDSKRMSDFYAKAFGWQTQQLGAEMGNYVVVTTSETGESGFPKEPGRINGGFFKKNKPDQVPSIVIAVDDIREAMKKVADAGGTVIGGSKGDGEPDEIPGVGIYCSFIDSEGNRVSMLQPLPMMPVHPQQA